jgi:hypothetical protein
MQKSKLQFKIQNPLIILIVSFVSFPVISQAAMLYLELAEDKYYQGDTFIIEARIGTEGKCINTVEVNLVYDKDILEAIDFSRGDSILTLWVKPLEINQESGLISFSGGIPGGYCGILPGEPGKPDLLGKIIFQAKEVNGGQFAARVEFLDTSQVLLNDGFGTPAKLTTKGAIFTILTEKLEVPKDEWQEELKKDIIPPEPFEIEIQQDPSIFEGKYFIIFSTTDKQTGIDYYEVKEGKKDWGKRDSPYLLEDQELKSIIKVRAVDKAGNERIAEYLPSAKPFPYWIIIIILVGIGIGYYLWRKRRTVPRQ